MKICRTLFISFQQELKKYLSQILGSQIHKTIWNFYFKIRRYLNFIMRWFYFIGGVGQANSRWGRGENSNIKVGSNTELQSVRSASPHSQHHAQITREPPTPVFRNKTFP